MSTPEQQRAFLSAIFEHGRTNFPPLHTQGEGMTKGEFCVLNLLREHMRSCPEAKGMYVSELAEQMRVTPPAVSRMLRGMECKGYIERFVDRSDRRTTYIVLTPGGERLRENLENRSLEFAGRIIDQMGAADVAQLVALWKRMKDIVLDELAKER